MSRKPTLLNAGQVMPPSRQQEGYVYVKVAKDSMAYDVYPEFAPSARTISAKRAEVGTEIVDYLTICKREGLTIVFGSDGLVTVTDGANGATADTIRNAYFRRVATL